MARVPRFARVAQPECPSGGEFEFESISGEFTTDDMTQVLAIQPPETTCGRKRQSGFEQSRYQNPGCDVAMSG